MNEHPPERPENENPPVHKTGNLARSLFVLLIAGSAVAMLVAGLGYWYFARNLPDIITVADYRPPIVSQVILSDGQNSEVVGEYFKTERRYVIPYDRIPQKVIQAFISAEDDQFFSHQGVNVASIIRAAIANFRAGHVVQGGSTITQQVAKSLLLTSEKSFVRKAKELILSSRMESNLTKADILYLYLNQIYLGHGAYGVQAAAKVYFDKDISQLTVAEGALIAGMPQAPGKYSPHLNPKKAKERQTYVLRRMYENKFISKAELDQALAEKLKVHDSVNVNEKVAPYYVEHLRRGLQEKYGEKALLEDGLTITVPGSAELMRKAGVAVKEGLRAIDKRNGYRGPIKRLKTTEEMEKVLFDLRIKLVMDELGYDVLMPEGALSTLEAVRLAGLESEADLLKTDSVYQGVVTSLDPKAAGVLIGVVKVQIPLDQMRWARAGISSPAQVLAKGDQVWVRIVKKDASGVILGGLEQDPEIQAALFSMDARTGRVLAMEGGFDFRRSEFNRATQALRQPGSAFKPMIFTAALERGFTPASIVVDSPVVYKDDENGNWKPANYEEKFYGDTTFRQALIKSRNIPTIKIVQSVQVPNVIDFAKRLGLNAAIPADLSISLGSFSLSLEQLTKAYAAFPRLGRKLAEPVYLSEVRDRDGKLLEERKSSGIKPLDDVMREVFAAIPSAAQTGEIQVDSAGFRSPSFPLASDPEQVMDPRVAYVATHLMKEVVSFGTGHEAKQLGRPAAGKTGTTNDYLDAWFMGFTPDVVTGVWVGYDSQKPIGHGETGARAALPIWLDYMKEAVKNYPERDFTVPPGVVFASIHPQTGKPAPPNASYAIKEAFIEGTEPTQTVNHPGSAAAPAPSTSDFLKEDIE